MSPRGLNSRCQLGSLPLEIPGDLTPFWLLELPIYGCISPVSVLLPHILLLTLIPCVSLIWPLWLHWVHLNNLGSSPHLKILNLVTSVNYLLRWKAPYSQIPGIRTWTSLGPHYPASHSKSKRERQWHSIFEMLRPGLLRLVKSLLRKWDEIKIFSEQLK